MYKLVIIDDEKRVREALKISIDWNKYSIEVVGEAEDGDIALDIIKEHDPDIIITDIYMARMDGLKLTQLALEIVPYAKIIILSGYDNFDDAQTALRHKAFDYLLKPIRFDRLEEAIKKTVKTVEDERQKRENYQEFKEQLEKSLPIIKERYLDYLLSNRLSLGEIKEQNRYINCNLADNNFVVLALEIDSSDNNLEAVERLGIKKAISDILFSEFTGEIIDNYPDKYIAILNYEDNQDSSLVIKKLISISRKMINYLKKILNKTLTIGIGGLYENAQSIVNSYEEALEALEYKLFYGKEEIYLIQDVNSNSEKGQLNYPFRVEEEIIMSIKIGDIENIEKWITEFFEHYLNKKELLPKVLKQACLQLYYTLLKKMVEWNWDIEDKGLEIVISNTDSFEELKEIMIKFISSLFINVNKEKEIKNAGYIKKVCKYINNNYHEDLPLENIADKVYLSPNYLSNIFKEKMGKTIITYLTDIRIDKAKELLLNTQLKIYEIGKKVGYNNSTYFGHVFKKTTGVTPNEYRQQNF